MTTPAPYGIEDEYLGDGVYASFPDGYHIVLDLRGQDNFTLIALEPAVMTRLAIYARRVIQHRETLLAGNHPSKEQPQ